MSEFDVPAGAQFESTLLLPGPLTQQPVEKVVRPFETFTERRDQRLEQLRQPPGAEDVVLHCWGDRITVTYTDNKTQNGGGFNTRDPQDDREPVPPPEFTFKELRRKVRRIRVENPDDSDQYVMIKRIEKMWLRGPSQEPFRGGTVIFEFDHSGRNEVTGG